MIHLELRSETQSKKLKRKYFHHKLSNLNLKRKDVADLLNCLSLMMFYKFLSKIHNRKELKNIIFFLVFPFLYLLLQVSFLLKLFG